MLNVAYEKDNDFMESWTHHITDLHKTYIKLGKLSTFTHTQSSDIQAYLKNSSKTYEVFITLL